MSWAIWITGVPGCGKSTVARAAAGRLAERGTPVRLLELDAIRRVLTPHPAYTDAEREVVYRSLVFMAVALTKAGVPVIIDATAHRRAWRELARASVAHFAEAQLQCPLDVAMERERTRTSSAAPHGIYAGADRPAATVPGVNVPYEPALSPELTVDTAAHAVEAAAEQIVALALTLGPATHSPDAPGGGVLWLTGPPGSGKTTLASRLAERLAAQGAPVTILEWTTLRRLALPAAWATEAAEEIAHRALAYTAKLLADAGRVVVVDATAPRRAWRALARELGGTFAEVQLVCPLHVCLDRERAVRWHPRPDPHGGVLIVAPDLALEYDTRSSPT
jgi:adenylylsulfate kinase